MSRKAVRCAAAAAWVCVACFMSPPVLAQTPEESDADARQRAAAERDAASRWIAGHVELYGTADYPFLSGEDGSAVQSPRRTERFEMSPDSDCRVRISLTESEPDNPVRERLQKVSRFSVPLRSVNADRVRVQIRPPVGIGDGAPPSVRNTRLRYVYLSSDAGTFPVTVETLSGKKLDNSTTATVEVTGVSILINHTTIALQVAKRLRELVVACHAVPED
jgi:hypothetical protein